jgi:hypothetical protein
MENWSRYIPAGSGPMIKKLARGKPGGNYREQITSKVMVNGKIVTPGVSLMPLSGNMERGG